MDKKTPTSQSDHSLDSPPLVLLTRQQHHLGSSVNELQSLGLKVAWVETLATSVCQPSPMLENLPDINEFTDILFVSRNAVQIGLEFFSDHGVELSNSGACLLTVGQETAKQLKGSGLNAFYPKVGSGAQALLDDVKMQNLCGQRILIVRGKHGLNWPAQEMRDRGAEVEQLVVYQQVMPINAQAKFVELMETHTKVNAVLLHSSLSATNFMKLAREFEQIFSTVCMVVGSSQIANTLRELEWCGEIQIAESPSNQNMLKVVKMLFKA